MVRFRAGGLVHRVTILTYRLSDTTVRHPVHNAAPPPPPPVRPPAHQTGPLSWPANGHIAAASTDQSPHHWSQVLPPHLLCDIPSGCCSESGPCPPPPPPPPSLPREIPLGNIFVGGKVRCEERRREQQFPYSAFCRGLLKEPTTKTKKKSVGQNEKKQQKNKTKQNETKIVVTD